jgi:hypothetical protein
MRPCVRASVRLCPCAPVPLCVCASVPAAHLRGRSPRVPAVCRPDAHRGRHHRPGGHHPHPRAPGPERRTRPPIPEPTAGPMPILRPRHGRAASVARSRSAPLRRPDPGPLGVPAAHRQSLAARFSPEPEPRRAPNTPHSPRFRPRPPTRCAIDAPTTRPNIRIGAKETPIHSATPIREPRAI